MLDNRLALVFIRGERAVMDEKTDLNKHPNAKYTTAQGGKPFEHGKARAGVCSIDIDLSRMDDYALLDCDDEEEMEEFYDEEQEEELN